MQIQFETEDEIIDFIGENRIVDDVIYFEDDEETLGDLIVETEEGKLFRVHYSYLVDIAEYCYEWHKGIHEVEKIKVERYEYQEKE